MDRLLAHACRQLLRLALCTAALFVSTGCEVTLGEPGAYEPDSGAGSRELPRCPEADRAGPGVATHPCCALGSNASRLAQPTFRITEVRFTRPRSLASPPLVNAANEARHQHREDWLLEITQVPGQAGVLVRTGQGRRAQDGSFRFVDTEVLAGGRAIELRPAVATGAVLEDLLWSGDFPETLVTGAWSEDRSTFDFPLPMRSFHIDRMQMSDDRDCVGEWRRRSFDTTQAQFHAFVRVEDVTDRFVSVDLGSWGPLRSELCQLLAGQPEVDQSCVSADTTTWPVPPDARCDDRACTTDCEVLPSQEETGACNAWRVEAGFSAQAVEIR